MNKLGWVTLGALGILVVLHAAEEATANEIEQTHSEPYIYSDNIQNTQSWINKMKNWKAEQNWTQPVDSLNNALAEYFNGSNDTTEQEELLQLSSDGDSQSIGWRYD